MRSKVALLLVSRGIASLLQAVLFAVLARTVSTHQFGTFTALTGVVGFALVFTGAGMPGIIARARARGDDQRAADAVTVTWVTGIASAVLLGAGIALWRPTDLVALILVSWGLVVERTTDALLNVPVADGHVLRSAWPIIARRAVAVALLLIAVHLGWNAMLSYAAASLVGAVVAQGWARLVSPLPRGHWRSTGELVREGTPFMLNTLAAQSRMLDTTLTTMILGPTTGAVYGAASKLVQPALLVPQAIASLLLPRAAQVGRAQARTMLRPMLWVGIASAVGLAPIALLARPLLVLVLGPTYADAAVPLQWLLAGMPFAAVAAPLTAILQGQGRERVAAWNGLVFAVLLLGGVAIGAVLAGPSGAAAGLSLSFVLRSITLTASVRTLSQDPRATGDREPGPRRSEPDVQ